MPKSPPTISLLDARRIALRAQGLTSEMQPFGAGKEAVLSAIQHLGYVQIDTISVVQRAHHHVLWSRLPEYRPELLHSLHEQDRSVFEYWNHAASYLPMRDFRYSLPMMRRYRREGHWSEGSSDMKAAKRRLLQNIRGNGPLLLRDVESKKLISSWWNAPPSKIERRALHELWMSGQVMVRQRQGFQKVFDLTENVIPPGTQQTLPTKREVAEFHILRGLRALGIARTAELHYLHDAERAGAVKSVLQKLLKQGTVCEVRIDAFPETPCYVLPNALPGVGSPVGNRVHILSPFDNMVIQRQRLRWLFNYDYLIECYVPAAKRIFGYFVLPILWGDRFIGRVDMKADRTRSRLLIQNIAFENGFRDFTDLHEPWRKAMAEFLQFQDCATFELSKATPKAARALFS